MNLTDLQNEVGSLSAPSKMPCHGYSIPAQTCKIGSALRNVANSVCSDCYALKNRYLFDNVQKAMQKRFEALSSNIHKWEKYITKLIRHKEKSGYFRWHDSGDLQSLQHLTAINNIAVTLSDIKFWLPTREKSIVTSWLAQNKLDKNLTIRISAPLVGSNARLNSRLVSFNKSNHTVTTSSVGWDESEYHCPAYKQGNKCGNCRACWDTKVSNVNYKLH